MSREEKIRRFEGEAYESKPIDDERNEFYTNKGERVRSKSEKIIADHFERRGILYRYEKPLYLMMDDSVYYNATLRKLDIYEKNDILLERDLLVFHETGKRALNMKNVDKYIQQYLV